MDNNEHIQTDKASVSPEGRDFTSISPSARWLLWMKGHTTIPFARQAAELIMQPDQYNPDFTKKDLIYWGGILHFEMRYWSIDQLLRGVKAKNILELSSGYSLRGLEMAKQHDIHYIDSDLPEVIAAKTKLVETIAKDIHLTGTLELLALNALDQQRFNEIVDRFPAGEIVIVNEGLLMYLDRKEKEALARTIHQVLKERGGYWIVADIYIKDNSSRSKLMMEGQVREYYEKHRIEENKFESFEDAESFFKSMGFEIDKVSAINPRTLSSWKYLRRSLKIWDLFRKRKAGRSRATWRLRVNV